MNPKIEILTDWTLERLIREFESGKIKIPLFQRDYIWDRNKVVKLLNSIYSQYPIGSLFFWDAPAGYEQFIRETSLISTARARNRKNFYFILDGQQRVISLYASLSGKKINRVDYKRIAFHLKRQEFYIPRRKKEKFYVPAYLLFDKSTFNEVLEDYKRYDENKGTDFSVRWQECHEIFMNYPMSIVKSNNVELDHVVEIFERINQGGNRLTLFDLVHATVLSEDFDLKERIQQLNKEPSVAKYGGLSQRVVVQSLAVNAFKNSSNSYQLKLTSGICLDIWDKVVDALKSSLDFLADIGIQTDMLQYQSMVPVLQYYFFINQIQRVLPGHKKSLEDWFWDAKFSDRYAPASASKIKEDLDMIEKMSE
jgi:hypothetical protein